MGSKIHINFSNLGSVDYTINQNYLNLNSEEKCRRIILRGHTGTINILKMVSFNNANCLLSGSADCTIKWNLNQSICLKTFENHCLPVKSLVLLSNKGSVEFISGSYDKTFKIWDLNKGCLKTFKDSNSEIHCMNLLENNLMAIGARDSTIKIFRILNNLKCEKTLIGHNSSVTCLLDIKLNLNVT
jgi:WD40 repeat protein